MKKRNTVEDVVEGPAVLTADHVQDRILSPRAGTKKGWSRLSVYEREFRRGALVCKERCTGAGATREEEVRALDRFAAARAFDDGWRICNTPFPPGVDFDRVRSSGGGTIGGFADHQRDAKDFWGRGHGGVGAHELAV